MRPLKILLLSRWYWEENRRNAAAPDGGPLRQLAEAVAALGHEVVVLSQEPSLATLEKSQIGPLEVWLTPREKKRGFLTGLRDKWAKGKYRHRKVYSDALDLADFLAKRGPFDVIWAHSEEPDGLVAAIAGQLGVKLPPVATQIQALRYQFENGVPRFNEQAALGLAFRHATRILSNSDMVTADLSHYGDAAEFQAKTQVVHPSLSRDFLRLAGNLEPAPLPETPRVLFFGALNEGKGALTFMEAIPKMKAAGQGASFAVIGRFTEKNPAFTARWEEAVRATQEKLSPGRLELLGKISQEEVIAQVRGASVVALPSLYDAFSRALVETLILGRPVVTTRAVGAWPLVKEHNCGLVVPPADSTALAEALDDVLAPDAPYLANAREIGPRLRHELSPEAIARQLVRHFEEIKG